MKKNKKTEKEKEKKLKVVKPKKEKKVKASKPKKERNTEVKVKNKKSKLFFIPILIIGIIIFIISYFGFGLFPAILIFLGYLILTSLTHVLDANPKKSKKRKLIKALFILILGCGVVCLLLLIGFCAYIAITAPDLDVERLERKETSIILDSNNKQYATLGTEKREKISYDKLPEVLVDAIIATEDSRFFQHNGFDAPRFLKASIGQFLGHDAGGASTITMQVSKMSLTSLDASGIQGIIRKFTDIYMSIFKIEKAFTKQEILEFYINTPFFGNNSYGVEQAARTYFNKNVSDLNLSEAALIAGLLQAPSAYDPFAHPEEAYKRRNTVLSLMQMHGYITKEEKDIANAIPIEKLVKKTVDPNAISPFQTYIDFVVNEIKNETGLDPYDMPMIIYSNMNRDKQLALNKVFSGETYKWPNDTIEGGVAALESHSGKIIAMGGGRNTKVQQGWNNATDINRQIGSTAKPLFDYGPGIEYNNWSTATNFKDEPWKYSDGTPIRNYDYRFRGDLTLREALRDSRNVTALKAFQSLDNEKIKTFVTTLGIKPEIDVYGGLHEAHAIGAFNGASPLELAGAYAAFSNGGYYYKPYAVSKIKLRESDETLEFVSEKVKAMSDSTAYMITSVLQGIARDIGVSYVVNGDVAVKTGATNYDRKTRELYGYPASATPDGWIGGYTSNITMALWTGFVENKKGVYLDNSQMYRQRNNLYKACAKAVFDKKNKPFVKPASAVWVSVEKGSDPLALPSKDTPKNMIVKELFKRGTEPTEVSNKYRKLDNPTGLTVKFENSTVKLRWEPALELPDIDKEKYGDFGYNIYHDGKLIEFTTDTSYDYTTLDPYGTYVVKSTYSKSNTNMSSGASITLESNISFEFLEKPETTLAIGETYIESSNPVMVYENLINVTSSAKIKKTITNNDTNAVVSFINTLFPTSYTIKYEVSYKGESKTFTKQVIVK